MKNTFNYGDEPIKYNMSTDTLRKNVGQLTQKQIVEYMQELEQISSYTFNADACKEMLHILNLHSINKYNLTLIQLEKWVKNPKLPMYKEKAKVIEAKQTLRNNGYYCENLWHVDDVKQNYECSDEDALEILDEVMTGEYIAEAVFTMVDLAIDNNNDGEFKPLK